MGRKSPLAAVFLISNSLDLRLKPVVDRLVEGDADKTHLQVYQPIVGDSLLGVHIKALPQRLTRVSAEGAGERNSHVGILLIIYKHGFQNLRFLEKFMFGVGALGAAAAMPRLFDDI